MTLLSDSGEHALHIDIMYCKSRSKNKIPILICYDSMMGYVNAVCMKSRSTRDVKDALERCILFLEKFGVKVGLINSDREGAFIEIGSKYKYRFKYTAGPGTHEPMAERMIQTVKDLFKVKRASLKLPAASRARGHAG